jgi:excisionase family DNA binding protein
MNPAVTPSAGLPRLLVPINEALRMLGGVSRSKIYDEIAARNLATVRIGRRIFVRTEELERYVDSLEQR